MSTRGWGREGENLALTHLQQEGFVLVCTNYTTRMGEIDLIVRKASLLVFVEVKWRRTRHYGIAAEGITWKKRLRIRQTITHYLLKHPHRGSIRIDAICIDGTLPNMHMTHLRNIG